MRAQEFVTENLRDWFKQKWVRFGPDGKIRGDCARGSEKEGKFDTQDRFGIYGLLGRIISVIISIASGLTGGLVIPALTIGCGLGSVVSKYTNAKIDQYELMFLGMVGLVSSFLNAPITSAVLLNKICNQPYRSIPSSLGVSFISYFTCRFLQSRF